MAEVGEGGDADSEDFGRRFDFDRVFGVGSCTADLFEESVEELVVSCADGFNSTIFSYGQTGSGKTYTQLGDDQNPGVLVLAMLRLFEACANDSTRDFLIRCSYVEIYQVRRSPAESALDPRCSLNSRPIPLGGDCVAPLARATGRVGDADDALHRSPARQDVWVMRMTSALLPAFHNRTR